MKYGMWNLPLVSRICHQPVKVMLWLLDEYNKILEIANENAVQLNFEIAICI